MNIAGRAAISADCRNLRPNWSVVGSRSSLRQAARLHHSRPKPQPPRSRSSSRPLWIWWRSASSPASTCLLGISPALPMERRAHVRAVDALLPDVAERKLIRQRLPLIREREARPMSGRASRVVSTHTTSGANQAYAPRLKGRLMILLRRLERLLAVWGTEFPAYKAR